ncbi:MAG: M15 family metallopeptidase [Gammaproteobacteria bacterium]|nr:M15 family metallopeptidase [Gammaproteobacteria bacterium]
MPNQALVVLLAELGIPPDYGTRPPLPTYPEAEVLESIGPNILGREQQLAPGSAAAWRAMMQRAADDAVRLLPVSGFRSVAYQAELIRNKLRAGQVIADILSVNVAPGYSQHHTGHAIDIATPGSKPLLEEFEATDAFAWLTANAGEFGFSLSYPRDNPEGLSYEPWHWYWSDA